MDAEAAIEEAILMLEDLRDQTSDNRIWDDLTTVIRLIEAAGKDCLAKKEEK